MASFEIIQDLVKLLQVQRQDVKKTSATTVLGLTADPAMCKNFVDAEAIRPLCRMTADSLVANEAISSLINIGAEVPQSLDLMMDAAIISRLMETLSDEDCKIHNLALMLLVNLTTLEKGAEKMMQVADPQLEGLHLRKLIRWHLNNPCPEPPADGTELEDPWQHVSTIVGNVTQIQSGRGILLRRSTNLLPQLVSQLLSPNPVRRKGVLIALKNVAFDEDEHGWLITTVGIVPHLLYVIGGPEEYTFEEKVDLDPMVWQEGVEKSRDPDRENCKLVLEILLLLCTNRQSREQMRKMGVFPVVKHLDNSVNKQADQYDDDEIGDLVYQIVNFLMRDEEPDELAEITQGNYQESTSETTGGGSQDLNSFQKDQQSNEESVNGEEKHIMDSPQFSNMNEKNSEETIMEQID
mmetsp:Transcript_16674/g.21633  ORF Transcript_16674/g.21633 Transcript_16674/m.21633 type:complete len:409 (+) Transcript_16674:3-1229(+)|eukprot:CAMPEP_0117860088 /NCGR_PEP_ID=MMETSP0950-20121206/3557_1 /TAXON_ID=44440 /ORGANISM="Chattonella subsalsa, Strain CCMP2191" /LENGTH=408 /DNA_ID=CAMNT_0005710159 /DNA_START=90 /DNA_END=1316 /DNA_ORIENTATION=+